MTYRENCVVATHKDLQGHHILSPYPALDLTVKCCNFEIVIVILLYQDNFHQISSNLDNFHQI